ncbi:unnamed protein product [Triticum turgidum subsp. durum]|uniref:Uncharacterized protein ycf68 n=1 Tax=Triticum turgidum subsp. durum TaxID=4567 RepID=A0A9R1BNQ8_TRITD|nr:unnamed protein product [Triticum turgidum subsp. durum]
MAYSSCLNRSLKPNKLLLMRIDGATQVRSHVDLNFYSLVGAGRPRTTRSPLSFWGEGGIIPFEPFFMLFLAVWRKQQSIGLS